ncbi:hypothetical protein C8J57DRAFT_1642904 [Mycena rebaudengoi]|nr:hypothetical protein C8J57DRAFT_1642904 [Mycena rebaudengoi]
MVPDGWFSSFGTWIREQLSPRDSPDADAVERTPSRARLTKSLVGLLFPPQPTAASAFRPARPPRVARSSSPPHRTQCLLPYQQHQDPLCLHRNDWIAPHTPKKRRAPTSPPSSASLADSKPSAPSSKRTLVVSSTAFSSATPPPPPPCTSSSSIQRLICECFCRSSSLSPSAFSTTHNPKRHPTTVARNSASCSAALRRSTRPPPYGSQRGGRTQSRLRRALVHGADSGGLARAIPIAASNDTPPAGLERTASARYTRQRPPSRMRPALEGLPTGVYGDSVARAESATPLRLQNQTKPRLDMGPHSDWMNPHGVTDSA